MKKTLRITLCAVCSALSVMVVMMGYFPYFTYAAPAVAGLFAIIPTVEIALSYGFATYITSSVFVLLFAEPETKILFLLLFGFYPVLKSVIDRISNHFAEWSVKLAVFTASLVSSYFVMKYLTNIDVNDFGPFGKYAAYAFIILCYFAFVLYDIAISRLSVFYFLRIRPKLPGVKK